jgi:hypothetical protein
VLIRRNVQLRRAVYRELQKQASRLGISVALLVRAVLADWMRRTSRGRRDWDLGVPDVRDVARRLRRR